MASEVLVEGKSRMDDHACFVFAAHWMIKKESELHKWTKIPLDR